MPRVEEREQEVPRVEEREREREVPQVEEREQEEEHEHGWEVSIAVSQT